MTLDITFISDVHNEFQLFVPENLNCDVLVLAGDIGMIAKENSIIYFLDLVCNRANHVLYVPGNHEYYKASLWDDHKLREIAEQYSGKVQILQNETAKIDDVTFIGATLWTDFDKCNPMLMYHAQTKINDYRLIYTGESYNDRYQRKIDTSDILLRHEVSREFIKQELETNQGSKTVVITHHGCSWQSVHPLFKDSDNNGLFVSELSDMILDYEPDYWFHGHVHNTMDYYIGKTRVLTNPRGYPVLDDLNPLFNDGLIVRL